MGLMSQPGEDLRVRPGPGLPYGLVVPAAELAERFSRSSGPGGQSVGEGHWGPKGRGQTHHGGHIAHVRRQNPRQCPRTKDRQGAVVGTGVSHTPGQRRDGKPRKGAGGADRR